MVTFRGSGPDRSRGSDRYRGRGSDQDRGRGVGRRWRWRRRHRRPQHQELRGVDPSFTSSDGMRRRRPHRHRERDLASKYYPTILVRYEHYKSTGFGSLHATARSLSLQTPSHQIPNDSSGELLWCEPLLGPVPVELFVRPSLVLPLIGSLSYLSLALPPKTAASSQRSV